MRTPRYDRVAFIGQSGSGKTSAALYLERVAGFNLVQLAGPIKAFVSDVTGLNLDFLNYGPRPYDVRRMMQDVGMAVRAQDEDAFLRALLVEVEAADPQTRWVVPDVRFENEARGLTHAGFHLIRLIRPGQQDGEHESERTGGLAADADIVGRSLPDLLQQVDDAVLFRAEGRQ